MALRPKAGHDFLIREDSRSHTTITTVDRTVSGRVMNSSQTPQPANTQHPQEINVHAPAVFEPTIPASDRPQIARPLEWAFIKLNGRKMNKDKGVIQINTFYSSACILRIKFARYLENIIA